MSPKSGDVQVWMAGGGIAAMAAAAFLVRDAGVAGNSIHILDSSPVAGGSLDGAFLPAQPGYVTRGGQMYEEQAYQCLWNLLESIPDLDDPTRSVRQVIIDFSDQVPTHARARLIDSSHQILDADSYGLSTGDRLEMTRLLSSSEHALGARRIEDMFSQHFFATNFWQMWRTTFAFQTWHSAVELRRYFARFIQEFPRISTLSGVRRTRYNQYDSIVIPLRDWLIDQKVDFQFSTTVTDIDFSDDEHGRRATAFRYEDIHRQRVQELGDNDYVFATLGSITADSSYGDASSPPSLIRDRSDGAWELWESIAHKADDFGRPMVFFGNIDENKWESFTLTMHNRTLLDRIVDYTANEPGTGALMTWVNSAWLMSIVVPFQPHFPDMPFSTYTIWGYGLFVDAEGDYVGKKMSQATGTEIMTELIHQLGFPDLLDEVIATTDIITVMMPYASSVFAPRSQYDRPDVLPARSKNFAFLGQFTELTDDVVFTVEYSVHGAMHAVYSLFDVGHLRVPGIYHGQLALDIGMNALRSAFR